MVNNVLIEKTLGSLDEGRINGRRITKVVLGSDDIMKPHQRVMAEDGQEVKISLPHGENLFCGAILYEDDEQIIAVDMPEEKVFTLYPSGNVEWARAAFNIGNMHQKAYLYEDRILVPYDYVLEKMMESLGVQYEVTMSKLDGLSANSGKGHHHEH